MRKSKQLFSICMLVMVGLMQSTVGQTPSWKWVKWSDGTQTTVRSICADASGNLYAAGTFNSSTKFDTAIRTSTGDAGFVVKYTESGNYVWARSIKNPGFAAVNCKGIAIDPAGNLYVTGAFSGTIVLDSKTLTGGGNYMAKYDNDGVIQWAIKTNGSNAVAANANGIYVVGGGEIQKVDANGAIAWSLSGVKSNQGYTNFFSVALNSSGNLIIAGDIDDKWTFGTSVIIGGYQNIILMEVSDAKAVTWSKVLGSNTNGADHAQHIAIDADNNIIMTGAVGGATMFNTVSIAAKNGYLLKLGPTGTAKWGTAISNITTIYGTGGIAVTTDKDRSMYVTGGYGNADVTDGGTTVFTKAIKAGGNAFIFKFDSAGVFKTALTNFENPTANNSRGMALASSTSGVYFGGVCAPSSEWGTLKVTGYGSVFAKIDGSPIVGNNPISLNNNSMIFPNPSKGVFTFQHNSSSMEGATLVILNNMGAKVYSTNVQEEKITIDITVCPKGIYFLQVQTEEGTVIKKIVIE